MKKLLMVAMMTLTVILIASNVFAQTFTTSPFIYADRNNWDEVAEAELNGSDARMSGVGASPYLVPGFYDPVTAPWHGVVWMTGGTSNYLQTTFNNPSTSLFVTFESDGNDGPADFYIDGQLLNTINTYNGGWFSVVITGLANTAHTLRVAVASNSYPRDLAIDAMGSGAPTQSNGGNPVPEPMTMLLFGPALWGLLGLKRKKA